MRTLIARYPHFVFIGISTAVTVIAWGVISLFSQPNAVDQTSTPPSQIISPAPFQHPLTGAPLNAPANLGIITVMVENSYEAWPLAGIEAAPLVIEIPAEGYIPRLLAIFGSDQIVDSIGPVRSARPYFIDWVDQFSALYAHSGGSPSALSALATNKNIIDRNEFSFGQFFVRLPDRSSPHNLFTSIEYLTDSLGSRTLPQFTTPFIPFTASSVTASTAMSITPSATTTITPSTTTSATTTSQDLIITWPSARAYDIRWKYSAASNQYTRETPKSGVWTAVKTASDSEITVANVIILEAEMNVLDSVGRLSVETIGNGAGELLQAGQRQSILWSKPSTSQTTVFTYQNGEPVTLIPGSTWIIVLPNLPNSLIAN